MPQFKTVREVTHAVIEAAMDQRFPSQDLRQALQAYLTLTHKESA